ncbi:hypothetical protein ANOM_002108 [Aspergillus nomiae NRRL 13137]|uniref:Uncharacterized protein n=1 Tax=Aspergillus nomiae NRRL (strain ATCC 15546 / NRRL 13137 / CBS 260.88 / M93) TaxID=1509407 RepID=A0A0L1JFH1_ASPN3|nr:uncharacterized protein ANOM_002108 [Aspergillus nomiae NRRL 13137]KNG90128.1 hypothetical protein ANOM_002108 [Aspergillus nomiae NRRL 13137]
MSTTYQLFDLDYNIYVIRDDVVELPVDAFSEVMLGMLLPKMNLKVISLDEALQALESSHSNILASLISTLLTAQARILGLDFDLSTQGSKVWIWWIGLPLVANANITRDPAHFGVQARQEISTWTTLFAC